MSAVACLVLSKNNKCKMCIRSAISVYNSCIHTHLVACVSICKDCILLVRILLGCSIILGRQPRKLETSSFVTLEIVHREKSGNLGTQG